MKKTVSIILAILLCCSLAGCAGQTAGKAGIQVGIVLPTRDEPRWTQDEASFTSILEKAGFSSRVLFSQGDPATELTNVESLILQGMKVLVICSQDAAAATAAVEKARKEGVKVICYDRLITDTENIDYYVTFNSFDVGVKQGQFLIDAYEGQKNVPLYLYAGATTDNNAYIFFSGAWSMLNKAVAEGQFVVANCPGIEKYTGVPLDVDTDRDAFSDILGIITTNWDFNIAKSAAEADLTAAPAAKKGDVAILAPNDGTARAIADAFSADDDITSYFITGQDCEAASLSYICSGLQSMTIWKNTASLAQTTCDMVSAILDGREPATTATYNNGVKDVPSAETPVTVITIENVNEPVDAGYVSKDDITGYPD